MSREETYSTKNKYFPVIDGTFRVSVPENHPEAVIRHWETPDGSKGVKYERIVHALFGVIEDIQIREGEYGKTLNIFLDENEDGEVPVISLSVSSRYGEDFLKKLPNIILKEEVRIRPFAFTPEDSEKEVRGIEISHKDSEGKFTVRVKNFFYDVENKKALNGYPVPENASEMDKEDWQIFYKQANKFLVKYAEENVLQSFAAKPTKQVEEPQEDINPEDIPF